MSSMVMIFSDSMSAPLCFDVTKDTFRGMSEAKPFSKEFLATLLRKVDEWQKKTEGPHYAAFDADGTLWDTDIGENFFQYQIDHCDLPDLKGIDPWAHYLKMKKKHPPDAYLWLAQINRGQKISTVRQWADKAVEKFPLAVFSSQKTLISELLKRDIKISVVSASVEWAVAAAVQHVGLKSEAALAVKTKIATGLVTDQQDGPVTWREGKSEALLLRTRGVAPLLSSGNTSGDLHLLQLAQAVSLAVQTQANNSEHKALHEDEQTLRAAALKNGWFTHSFHS